MHDLQVFASAVGALVTAIAVAHKTNRADYDDILKEKETIIKSKDSIINELRLERDEFKKDYYEEKTLRKKLEKELKELKSSRP